MSSPETQRTFVLLKPDTVRRGLVGTLLDRFERRGLRIVAMEQRTIDGAMADRHYVEHVERDFYPPLRPCRPRGPSAPPPPPGPPPPAVGSAAPPWPASSDEGGGSPRGSNGRPRGGWPPGPPSSPSSAPSPRRCGPS